MPLTGSCDPQKVRQWSATMTAFFTDFAERNARTGRPSPTPLEIQRWEDDGGAVLPRRDASEATTAAAPDNRCADPRVGRGRLKPKTRGNARSPAEGPPPAPRFSFRLVISGRNSNGASNV